MQTHQNTHTHTHTPENPTMTKNSIRITEATKEQRESLPLDWPAAEDEADVCGRLRQHGVVEHRLLGVLLQTNIHHSLGAHSTWCIAPPIYQAQYTSQSGCTQHLVHSTSYIPCTHLTSHSPSYVTSPFYTISPLYHMIFLYHITFISHDPFISHHLFMLHRLLISRHLYITWSF